MPIVRVNDKGDLVKNRKARWAAGLATVTVLAGVIWFISSPVMGLFTMILGNSLASIWNLADDS
jgi:ABC-type iron transport system FetAB permease component